MAPVEWCRPVPAEQAWVLAGQYPELTLRTEPAHREAYVPIPVGTSPAERQLVSGMRITYLASEPVTETSRPGHRLRSAVHAHQPTGIMKSSIRAEIPSGQRSLALSSDVIG